MSIQESASATKVSSGATTEKRTAGGAGGIEIIGFPQVLFTRTFGDPDMLFAPLLDATREAYGMIERLSGHGENQDSAVTLSGMQLASSLLRDSSFSLVAKGLSHENLYTVDLNAGTLQVHTRLYAVVSRRASFFKVEIAGKIAKGSPFVLRDPAQGTVIMQVEEEKLRQANYFASTLGQECLKAQIDQERFGRVGETPGSEGSGEVRLTVAVSGKTVPVILRQKEQGGGWDIVDGRQKEWVGTLSSDLESHLKSLTSSIQDLFAQK